MQDLSKLTQRQLIARLKELNTVEPARPGAEDVAAMDAREERIQVLYHLAGRHDPKHSMHGLLTGLNEQPPF